MLERAIINFVSWFIKPLGYSVVHTKHMKFLQESRDYYRECYYEDRIRPQAEQFKKNLERLYPTYSDNVIKVDFKV
jgi:hypothetical protein